MTKQMLPLTAAVMVFLALLTACGKGVDVVNGTKPVSNAFNTPGFKATLADLATMPPSARAARLSRDYPNLPEKLVYYLHHTGKVSSGRQIEAINYSYGSLAGVKAETGDGMVKGHFENQLVANVTTGDVNHRNLQTQAVIVQCLNGTFTTPEELKKLQTMDLGSRVPPQEITIQKGQGLNPYVGYLAAIDLAVQNHLKLFRGRAMTPASEITPAQARAMEPKLAETQVTVAVNEGDRFNLATGIRTAAAVKQAPPKHKKRGHTGRAHIRKAASVHRPVRHRRAG